MALKSKTLLAAVKKLLLLAMILLAGYFLVLFVAVIWAFEVKLQRWPILVYGAPSSVGIGDDIASTRLLERLGRLGYVKSPVVVPGPGEWSVSGSGLNVYLKHCPLKGQGIVSGPVTFALDMNRISSLRLMRANEDVTRLTLEPELIGIIPADGDVPRLCRPLSLEKIPPMLIDAIVLTEDTHFFSHRGIDTDSIFRALKTNIKAGRYVQGGSTISQQLMRMTLLNPVKTLPRKVTEILLAMLADALYSKQRILQAYLNRVYFGHWGAYPVNGVAEASTQFLGKDLSDLDPAECALLAAIIRAPNVINPHRHPERARSRRNMVLGLLLKEGKISRDVYEEALAAPVNMRKTAGAQVKAPAFLESVKQRLPGDVTDGGRTERGVITSLDPLIQNDASVMLRQVGGQGQQAWLIFSVPRTGEIKAFIAPDQKSWDGRGGNLEVVLPMALIPSFIPGKAERPKFTLASQVSSVNRPLGHVTFKEAFAEERQVLILNLSATLGGEKVVGVLKEFGITARLQGDHDITVDPVTPLEMAHLYALMAALGKAEAPRPGIKVIDGTGTESRAQPKHISIAPNLLFLVNYLLKGVQALGDEDRTHDKDRPKPSVFVAKDQQGLWAVAYRSDSLALLRVPGKEFKDKEIGNMLAALLPPLGSDARTAEPVPDGVVFRKVCIESGMLATSICPRVSRDPFLKGTQPSEWCPIFHGSRPARTKVR